MIVALVRVVALNLAPQAQAVVESSSHVIPATTGRAGATGV
jgi:hypothetical protein